MKRRKHPQVGTVCIYGVWCLSTEQLIDVSLTEEEAEFKKSILSNDEDYAVVRMDIVLFS
jgi:hypothetical protein